MLGRVRHPDGGKDSSRALRVEFAAAAGVSALLLSLYLATLCKGVYWSDSAEYATAAYTLGVPHPPGYPLYTLLARGFVALPLSPAHGVNLMSALFAALAGGLCFGVARALGAGRLAAAASALLLGSGEAFWHNATVAEVYAPGLCFALGVLLWLLRARAHARPRMAVAAAALAGLGLGVHYSLATLGLGYAWLAAAAALRASSPLLQRPQRARQLLRWLVACAGATAAGFALACSYFTLLAASDGVPNYAHPPTPLRLLWLLSGGNYRLWFVAGHEPVARAAYVARILVSEVSAPGFALALAGLLALALRARAVAIACVLALIGNLLFFFRYRVDDLEVFLLPSVAVLCACAGVGIQALAEQLRPVRARQAALIVLPLIVIAATAARVRTAYPRRDLSGFTAAQDFGERLSRQLPHRAVILNYTTPDEWRYDAVFGMYFQHVLGRRPDAMVVKNADRPVVDRLLAEARPLYLYAPVAHVAREYVLVREGDLHRVVARR